ncbi:MAG: TIGR03067 domain-containing protein [Kiritimatiellia bacterium]
MVRGVVVGGLFLPGRAGELPDEPGTTVDAAQVARLIRQLGDDAFVNREAAGRELSAIGDPALAALKAAATGSDDPEIRIRAEGLVRAIQVELPKKALAMIEGTWIRQTAEANGKAAPKDNPPNRYTFKGNSVSVRSGDQVVQQATWTIAGVSDGAILVDYAITAGVNQGVRVRGIYTLDNDELRWCYRFEPQDRPAAFETKPGDNTSLVTMKRELDPQVDSKAGRSQTR